MTEQQVDPVAEALWNKTLEAWEDDAVHGAFLEHCIRTKNLPYAAGQYRAIQVAGNERSERAKKKIDAIVIAAMQMLSESKTETDTKNNRWFTMVAFLISLVFLVWVLKAMAH